MTVRVYGRTEYAEPLAEIGVVEDGEDVPGAYEGEWVELVAFPEEAIHWIIREGESVEDD